MVDFGNVVGKRVCVDRKGGFTLFELIAAIVILGILSTLAAPRIGELFDSYDRRNAELQIVQDMRLAQKISVEQGCQGILQVSVSGESYSFGCDYVPYSSTSPRAYDSILFSRTLPTDITLATDQLVIFNTRGQTIDSNGVLDARTVTLRIYSNGTNSIFNTGTLSPAGFFQLAH